MNGSRSGGAGVPMRPARGPAGRTTEVPTATGTGTGTDTGRRDRPARGVGAKEPSPLRARDPAPAGRTDCMRIVA